MISDIDKIPENILNEFNKKHDFVKAEMIGYGHFELEDSIFDKIYYKKVHSIGIFVNHLNKATNRNETYDDCFCDCDFEYLIKITTQ